MLRTLPPAGHPLRLREIISIIKGSEEHGNFLDEWFPNIPIYPVSSGTAALTLALLSLKVNSKRTEVILPAYTCPSLVASVVKAGLTPVLCDLRPFSFQLDLERLSSKIGPKTLAVMAAHLFGLPEKLIELSALTRPQGVFLIEDSAQAFVNKIGDGKYMESGGDLAVLSFGRGKPMSLLSGGAVIVNNPDLDESVSQAYRALKEPKPWLFLPKYFTSLFIYSIFFHPRMHWFPKSLPWLRLGETHFSLDLDIEKVGPKVISLGNRMFKKFQKIKQTRMYLAKLYEEKLEKYKEAFEYFPDCNSEDIALLRFPIIFKKRDSRDRTLAALEKKGLGATGSYPVPLNELEGAAAYFENNEIYPNAKNISERILTLPLHEYVTLEDVEFISHTIKKVVSQ
jgi:dTDP-4-amino-4,6-dideoxygalactose transaminase